MSFASLDEIEARARARWRPPPKLTLSEWADRNWVMSSESSATPGRWKTLPYQREIMDSMTDPEVEEVSFMKSARLGWTLMVSAAVGFWMQHDPSSMLMVQPTVDDARGYSKETIAPMLRDVPVLRDLMTREVDDPEEQRKGRQGRKRKRRGPKDASDTIRHKAFPGGVLSLVGANSGAGFRRVSRRIVIFDEADAYPSSSGTEGDPISLGTKRTEAFHNRKVLCGSTPLIAGTSRIEARYLSGDQRLYHVPCPSCGHYDYLTFNQRPDRDGKLHGHYLRWPDGEPEKAFFVCSGNGCAIEHRDKRSMIERGRWVASRPGGKHRSYLGWAAMSYSPNAKWSDIAKRWVEAKKAGPDALKTVVNTDLAETWTERGEAPEWENLYARRELYPIGTVPAGVDFLTAGVDVQRDRLEYEVVGWAAGKTSWSVDAGTLWGDTALDTTWNQLAALLARTFPGPGGDMPIRMMAVDSGYAAQMVYSWTRGRPGTMAVKGTEIRTLLGPSTRVDVTTRGKTMARGARLWPVNPGFAKKELYGFLRLRVAQGEEPPPGYCHFPEYDEEFFRQLTAEHLVAKRRRSGVTVLRWEQLPNRENHKLDCRVYARAAAARLGLDRMPVPPREPKTVEAAAALAATVAYAQAVNASAAEPREAPSQPDRVSPAPSSPPRRQGSIWGGRTGLGGGRSIWGRRGR